MVTYFITFRSVTFAQRGESVLRREGVSCRMQRTPRWMEEQGCGYSLSLRAAELNRSVQLLREQQVPFRKVYLRRDDGGVEEVAL